ncbi:MAG: hypothetical protein AAGC49_05900 [Brevundimonas sp.]
MVAIVEEALAKAVAIPSATIHAHVESVRRRNPEASPAQLIRLLEKEYLLVVGGAGGAVGAAAAAPAVGTGVAIALTASDVATFFGASAAFVLAVASVHGIDVEDTDRRTTLLLTSLLGDDGAKAVNDLTGQGAPAVARMVITRMPLATIKRVNTTLTRRMVRKQAAKQGGLFFGRLLPYGIGIVVGVSGGRALGRTVIQGARAAFGNPPSTFGHVVELVPVPPKQLPDAERAQLPPGAEPKGKKRWGIRR